MKREVSYKVGIEESTEREECRASGEGKSAKGKYRKSTNKRLALCPANPTINCRECKYDVGAENNLITSNCSALCFMFNLDLTV